jgi:hypothetical protein
LNRLLEKDEKALPWKEDVQRDSYRYKGSSETKNPSPTVVSCQTIPFQSPVHRSSKYCSVTCVMFLSATLLATLVAAIPLDVASTTLGNVASLNGTSDIPYFGHLKGNFQTNSGASLTPAVVNGPEGVWTIVNEDGIGEGSDVYRQYWGDGGPEAGWPAKSQWVSFKAMFDNNKAIMFRSCGWNNWGADNSGEEIGQIYNAIQKVALETGVDHRFILATIIQESGGCTRVRCKLLLAEAFI